MATTNFYPNAHPETTSVDGYCYHNQNHTAWAALVAAAGNAVYDSSDTMQIIIFSSASTNNWSQICRAILLFDTSALGAGCTILSATLHLTGCAKVDNLGITPSINIYGATPASNTALAATDYANVGSTPFCDTEITYASFNNGSWNIFALNVAGLAAIDSEGISKFSIRNANYDVSGTPPTWASANYSQMGFYSGDSSHSRPYLAVTYKGIPTISTQSMSDVVGDTATGNGTVEDLSDDNLTQHGHCWATSASPTTADSKTTLGAKSTLGTFVSSLTGLTPGTGYYVRAYGTNSVGTSYGDNVYFKASLVRAGVIWMEGSNLHGFDENAVERTYIHTIDVDDTPVNNATTDPISSNWAYDHNDASTGVHGAGANTLLNTGDVDDVPVDSATTAPVSSNWAYDHVAAADPHTGYRLESADHTHASTGAEAGQLDHGLAMTAASLLDDDHTQYQLESSLMSTIAGKVVCYEDEVVCNDNEIVYT